MRIRENVSKFHRFRCDCPKKKHMNEKCNIKDSACGVVCFADTPAARVDYTAFTPTLLIEARCALRYSWR